MPAGRCLSKAGIALDVATVAAGLVLVWIAAARALAREVPVLQAVAAGLLLGLVGRFLGPGRTPRKLTALVCAGMLTGLAAATQPHHLADWIAHPNSVAASSLLWSLAVLAPTCLASVGLTLGPRASGFVLGVAMVALPFYWPAPATPALLVLAFLSAQGWGRDANGGSARERVAAVGLGALAELGVFGLVHDLTALANAHEIDFESYARWVALDSPAHLGMRVGAEVLVVVGALTMARDKTAGLLLLVLATPMLVPTILGWGEMAAFGGGCMGWGHPFDDGRGRWLAAALGLAVLPWLRPLWHGCVARERQAHAFVDHDAVQSRS